MSALQDIPPPLIAEHGEGTSASVVRPPLLLRAQPPTELPVLTVVVPVFDEVATVGIVLERLKQLPFAKEIIVVDDCSTDGTAELLARYADDPEIVLLRHTENRGKGAALRTAFAQARGYVLAVQDADLEYDPTDLTALIRPILAGEADVVYGSRLSASQHERDFMLHHLVANHFFSAITRVLFRTSLSDIHTCYKVMRRDVLEGVVLRSNDFRADSELTAKILRANWRIQESPISYRARSHDEGKKISWRDGFPSLVALFRYRFAD
jgi:glycosyltransferase involved in cell wall biosynthesis